MKTIKYLVLCTLLLTGLSGSAQTEAKKEQLVWYTDIMKANEVSKASNKPLFAFFTGSDWCGWCKKLQNDVFSKAAFIEWASKNVVLVELDFPRFKKLSPELTQQNNSLQQTFQVQGYPTIWLFFLNKSAQGNGFNIDPLGSLGYPRDADPGREELKFLKDANELFKKKNLK